MRVVVRERVIDAKLALGGHLDVVGELEALIGENPLRERLRGQLMLALYRCERQADALQAYQDARRRLVEELGIEPGQRLRDLERAILAQDPALQLPPLEAAELPPVLGASTQLVGREAEVDWLREQWRRSHGGAGRLVLIAGPGGIGKTRLAAELAAEAHRERGEVLYISHLGAPDAGREVLAKARATRRPSLLVIDDADRAGDWLWPALAELAAGWRRCRCSYW